MEIKGTFNMDVGKIQLPATINQNGQQIYVDGEIKVNPDQAKSGFGDAFHYVAFATMHDGVERGKPEEGDATVTRFGYDSKKAPRWLTPAVHSVEIAGIKQKTQPEIRKIVAGKNERAVIVSMRFVFDTNRDSDIVGAIGILSGTATKVKLKPVQNAAFSVVPKEDAA